MFIAWFAHNIRLAAEDGYLKLNETTMEIKNQIKKQYHYTVICGCVDAFEGWKE